MIKLENGRIAFKDKVLLDGINLEIPESKLTIIIGPNGTGKTTLINTIAGLRTLSSGNLINSSAKNILIPQKAQYPEDITLSEYLTSVFFNTKWQWFLTQEQKDRVNEVLKLLSLSAKMELHLSKLSAGELQLANIGLSLLSDAKLIILDEPSANLDLINQVNILKLLKKLVEKNITVIAVMHDINLAYNYGDYFVLISKDGNIFSGCKNKIFTSETLSLVYGYNFDVIENDETTYFKPVI